MKYLVDVFSNFIDVSKLDISSLENQITEMGFESEILEDFNNLNDFIVGRVVNVTKHTNSEKLNICDVKTSKGTQVIVTGASNVRKDTWVIVVPIGKKVGDIVIEKRDLRGVDSFGMMCSLSELGFQNDLLSEKDKMGIQIIDDDASFDSNIRELLGYKYGSIEVDILSNRNDVSSYYGMAREISWKNNIKFNDIKECGPQTKEIDKKITFSKDIDSTLSLLNLKDDITIPSNFNMSLVANKIRYYSNFEDATNFFTLLMGYPVIAIDYEKLNDIKYTFLKVDKKVHYNGEEFVIPSKTPVLMSGEEVVAIPGVVTFDNFRVSSETKKVLVDSSILGSDVLRGIDQKIKSTFHLISRQNKGINNSHLESNLSKFLTFSKKHNFITSSYKQMSSISIGKKEQISIDSKYLESITGVKIDFDDFKDSLSILGYDFVDTKGKWPMKVLTPKRRVDIHGKADLLEDYIRVRGLEFLSEKVNFFVDGGTGENNLYNFRKKFSKKIESLGLINVLTDLLVTKKDNLISNIFDISSEIKLDDSYNKKKNFLRKGMYSSLLDSYLKNYNKKREEINLYEISKSYNDDNENTYSVGMLFDQNTYVDKLTTTNIVNNFVYVKTQIFNVLSSLGISNIDFNYEINNKIMHPYNSVSISVNSKVIGYIFEVHPSQLVENKINRQIFYSEINLSDAFSFIKSNDNLFIDDTGKQLIERDLTIQVLTDSKINKDYRLLLKEYSDLESIMPVSVYQDEKLLEIKSKTISFKIKFYNNEDITNDKIEKTLIELKKKLYN